MFKLVKEAFKDTMQDEFLVDYILLLFLISIVSLNYMRNQAKTIDELTHHVQILENIINKRMYPPKDLSRESTINAPIETIPIPQVHSNPNIVEIPIPEVSEIVEQETITPQVATLEHKYTKNSDIFVKNRKLDSVDIDLLISKYPWYSEERDLLIEIASKTKVDLLILFSIGQLESCNGTKGSGRKYFNIWGHMSKGKIIKYKSKKEGIMAGWMLFEKYIERDRTTIAKVAQTYNPDSSKFVSNIVYMMNHLTEYLNENRKPN